jgi:hypothetical protein
LKILCIQFRRFGLRLLNQIWFPIVLLSAYLINVIPETCRVHWIRYQWWARVAQWARSLDLTTHTSLSSMRRGFAPSFVNYKKGCTRLTVYHDIAEILLKVALNTKIQIHSFDTNVFIRIGWLSCLDLLQGFGIFALDETPLIHWWLVWFMVLNDTFNNISAISWRSVLLVEETEVPGENHCPVTSHWQT